jgi:hypothetical protein
MWDTTDSRHFGCIDGFRIQIIELNRPTAGVEAQAWLPIPAKASSENESIACSELRSVAISGFMHVWFRSRGSILRARFIRPTASRSTKFLKK